MSHSAAIRCALTALLLLISTNFVLAATIQDDFLYSDEQVTVAPKTNWSYAERNGTCQGIRTGASDEKHRITLNFTGVGIAVYGYADPQPARWRFQVSDEAPETLTLAPNPDCTKPIKNRQGLKNGQHRVIVTALETSFVLTKFSVTQDNKPVLTTGEIIGIVIGGVTALLAVPGVYFGYKEWSRRKTSEAKSDPE